ncbi:MAG: SAM-dependent methyltransferase [Acidobacteriota bacterium]
MADQPKVFLVSAGLGDPDLLTRKAERILRTADAVIHDRFVSAQVLCLANSESQVISLDAVGSQEEQFADLCGWYLRLRESITSVVRLLAADPLLNGEANEELEFLARHGFDVEILPGVIAETVYECRAAVREAKAALEAARLEPDKVHK